MLWKRSRSLSPLSLNCRQESCLPLFRLRLSLAFAAGILSRPDRSTTFEPPPARIRLDMPSISVRSSCWAGRFAAANGSLHPLLPHPKPDPLTYRLHCADCRHRTGILGISSSLEIISLRPNVLVWVLAVAVFVWAFWLRKTDRILAAETSETLLTIPGRLFFIVAATALVFFFRFYQTPAVPPEPFSDHAEKILDVYDVSQGQTHIFFPRNTGREAFQMYWTLLVAKLFGTGLSFLSLKLGTAILGFLTLPFIYLLGKEIGGRACRTFCFHHGGNWILAECDQPSGTALSALSALRSAHASLSSSAACGPATATISCSRACSSESACMVIVRSASCRLWWSRRLSCTGFIRPIQRARRNAVIWLTLLALNPCSFSAASALLVGRPG